MSEIKKDDRNENGRGYERSDANVRALAKFGLGLLLLGVIVIVSMVWLIDFLEKQKSKSDRPPHVLAGSTQGPPEPRLQVMLELDLKKMRAAEDSILASYGWVLEEAGVARVPIDRAMELLLERGLPARSEDRGSRNEDRGSSSQRNGEQP